MEPEVVDFVNRRAWLVLAISVLRSFQLTARASAASPSDNSTASKSCFPEWSAKNACTSAYCSSSDSASRGLSSSTTRAPIGFFALDPALYIGKHDLKALLTSSYSRLPCVLALMMAFCSSLSSAQFRAIQPRAGLGKSVLARRLHLSNVSRTLAVHCLAVSPSEADRAKTSPSASPIRSVASFSGNLSSSTFHRSASPPSTARLSNVRCSTASQAAPSNRV